MVVSLAVCSVMAQETKTFTEFGKGVARSQVENGRTWDLVWGFEQWDWYNGDTSSDVSFVNDHLVGVLNTKTTDVVFQTDDLIFGLNFTGSFHLMAKNDDGSGKVAGEITGDLKGIIVADLNAARAIVDEEAGIILIALGAYLIDPDNPVDAEVSNIQTTGKYKSIQAEGSWRLSTKGVFKIQILYDDNGVQLPPQTNIFVALGNHAFVLGGVEEVVLTGSYSRNSMNK